MSEIECLRTYIDINIFLVFVCVEITSEIFPCILDTPYRLKNPRSLLKRSTSNPNPNTTNTSTPIRNQSLMLFILLHFLEPKIQGYNYPKHRPRKHSCENFNHNQTEIKKKMSIQIFCTPLRYLSTRKEK
jgi:hypothetical protein